MTVNATEPTQFALEISGSLGPFLSPSHELLYFCKQLYFPQMIWGTDLKNFGYFSNLWLFLKFAFAPATFLQDVDGSLAGPSLYVDGEP